MAKVSKNAKTNRQAQEGSKDYVKVIMSSKSPKTGAYQFREKIVHKDLVKDFVAGKSK
jgi:ribosomal protein L32